VNRERVLLGACHNSTSWQIWQALGIWALEIHGLGRLARMLNDDHKMHNGPLNSRGREGRGQGWALVIERPGAVSFQDI